MLTQVEERGVPRTETRPPAEEPVVITGAAVGTPGTEKVFDDGNLSRLLHGEQLIGAIRRERDKPSPIATSRGSSERGRLGWSRPIDDPAGVLKLAGPAGAFDLTEEFGVDAKRRAA